MSVCLSVRLSVRPPASPPAHLPVCLSGLCLLLFVRGALGTRLVRGGFLDRWLSIFVCCSVWTVFVRAWVIYYLPSATRNPLLQKLKLLTRWSWSHSGSEDWTAWSCGGEEAGIGGTMFDCQDIMSFKLARRLSRIWLATSSLELNRLLKTKSNKNLVNKQVASKQHHKI